MNRVRNFIAWTLIVLGCVLSGIGCAGVYKGLGLSDPQVKDLVEKDQAETIRFIETNRELFWQIATVATAGVGTILSALLARWVGVERKISGAIIAGVESADNGDVKKAVQAKAVAAGVEGKLAKRVKAITG